MQILNDPLIETSEKNRIFGDFFAFFLQLTISILRRFVKSYLLLSFFCRNFAVDFVTNSRGKSESSGSPTKLAKQRFGGESGDNRAVYAASGIRQRDLANAFRSVPSGFYRTFIVLLPRFERNTIVGNC